MNLTPGALFLSRLTARTTAPYLAFHYTVRACAKRLEIHLPTGVIPLGAVLLFLLVFIARVQLDELQKRREAAALGARLAPRVQGRWLGNWDVLQTMMDRYNNGYIGARDQELKDIYGPTLNIRVLWQDMIFTSDPNSIKTILATEFHNFEKGERVTKALWALFGSGVFNSDGDMWKFHRSMTRPFFSRDRISHFELFDRRTQLSIVKLKERLDAGIAVDFQDLMLRLTMDVATEFLFGSCVDSLKSELPYPHPIVRLHRPNDIPANAADAFSSAFMELQHVVSVRTRLGSVWPLFEVFEDKSAKPMAIVNAHIAPIVAAAMERRRRNAVKLAVSGNEKKAELEEDETLLDHLVKMTSDPKILQDETINILVAGRDTTASTLTFLFYLLATHPDVLVRLRQEILTVVGSTRSPTYDDVRQMKYLRAAINETLRLYPVIPFNVRESIKATTWPSPNPLEKPIYIPARTKVPYSAFVMHRREDLWGPDAQQFDPDRFLDERQQRYIGKNPFIFLPFNAGPRICLGQQFAYNEMSFIIIRFLQRFESLSMESNAQPLESRPPPEWKGMPGRQGVEKLFPKSHITMFAAGGLWMKMREVTPGPEGV